MKFVLIYGSKGSPVSVVTELQDTQLGFDSQHGQGFFSLCHHIQTSSGAHPILYKMGTRVSLSRV